LSFGDPGRKVDDASETASPAPAVKRPYLIRDEMAKPVGSWQMPDVRSKIGDAGKNEFRLRFSSQTWTGKIGSPEILSDQKMSSSLPAKLQDGMDYCTWRPGAANLVDRLLANEPDADFLYSLEASDKKSQSAASIVFDIRTRTGIRLGTLQCFFPRAESAAQIDFARWVSIVGSHLVLEIRR
jgi:hypothetical protein